jgi:hypothetical protein
MAFSEPPEPRFSYNCHRADSFNPVRMNRCGFQALIMAKLLLSIHGDPVEIPA